MIFNDIEYKDKQSNNKDIGKTFGRLKILGMLERTIPTKSHTAIFKCQCLDCGDIIAAQTTRVRNNTAHNCSCFISYKDLEGQKFGDWTVIGKHIRKNAKTYWPCRCSCGEEKLVRADRLLNGTSQSCGCRHTSIAARKIEQILKDNNISFVKEKCFPNCKSPRGVSLRFDFAILNNENQISRLIEYDGEFHYHAQDDFFGGEEELKHRQECDKIKTEYARSHNIPLVRIPYFQQQEICYDNLFNNHFLSC